MSIVNDFRWRLGDSELVPIVIGGMGVNISTAELALEACRLGGVGHISDAMVPHVSDRLFGTEFVKRKALKNRDIKPADGCCAAQFDLADLRDAQKRYVSHVMSRKKGPGMIFINVMEKLTMGDPLGTLEARLVAALDGGIDGITMSAGLHINSLRLIADHPRFREAKLGIIVSSDRALKLFLRSASRYKRLPDYIVVEGPLAGGHLGWGLDWKEHSLEAAVAEVSALLKAEELSIPIIPAGGIFTGGDAAKFLEAGASAVQVATRFTIARECGLPDTAKQEYCKSSEEQVIVNCTSPTGYLIRMLTTSPSLSCNIPPQCQSHGYLLGRDGVCQYIEAYEKTGVGPDGRKLFVDGKTCLCHQFGRYGCYTCGHYAYRLKDTTNMLSNGLYQLPTTEDIFHDYQFSAGDQIARPKQQS